jgi:hypothetical protein
MPHFAYRNGLLPAKAVNLAEVAASVGTPFYCCSTATLTRHHEVFAGALRRSCPWHQALEVKSATAPNLRSLVRAGHALIGPCCVPHRTVGRRRPPCRVGAEHGRRSEAPSSSAQASGGKGAAMSMDTGLGVATTFGQARSMPTWVACVARVRVDRRFIARLPALSDGMPVGFKLCIGRPWEFMAICKAILETGIRPDFIAGVRQGHHLS